MKIDKKITGYKVLTDKPEVKESVSVQVMHEDIVRPEVLIGSTYKIKTPQSEHAMYITINDIVLNQGTEHEERRPYEMFINSKNMEHFQWVLAITRVISSVFRKGGDSTFLIEELQAVVDPKGGWWERSTYIPSIVAKIGSTLKEHMLMIGMIEKEVMPDHVKQILEEKVLQAGGLANAQVCAKCNEKAVILLDGCLCCSSCGDSKCG